jgi:hypothetical protein
MAREIVTKDRRRPKESGDDETVHDPGFYMPGITLSR